MPPSLPQEIIDTIFTLAQQTSAPENDSSSYHFYPCRSASEIRQLVSFARIAGWSWTYYARRQLWRSVQLGSSRAVEAFLGAISSPEGRGRLVRLIQHVDLYIGEREIASSSSSPSSDLNRQLNTPNFSGVRPDELLQIRACLPTHESYTLHLSMASYSPRCLLDDLRSSLSEMALTRLDLVSLGASFGDALHLIEASTTLITLNVRGLTPRGDEDGEGGTAGGGYIAGTLHPQSIVPNRHILPTSLRKLVLWDSVLSEPDLHRLCTSFDTLARFDSLKELVLHRLDVNRHSPPPSLDRHFQDSLIRLLDGLETFHLVLPTNETHPFPFILDNLARHFSSSLTTLVIGGHRLFTTPTLYQVLTEREETANFRLYGLTFLSCTYQNDEYNLREFEFGDTLKMVGEKWAGGIREIIVGSCCLDPLTTR
ncbi:hypothetical protein JCM5350_005462 [Sporobolomyces pararoseus]